MCYIAYPIVHVDEQIPIKRSAHQPLHVELRVMQ